MFSLTPAGKQQRSRTSKPLGGSIITLGHTATSDWSALLVQFCTAASGTNSSPPSWVQSHTAASSTSAAPVGPFWSLGSVAQLGLALCRCFSLAFCSLGVASPTHRCCPSAPCLKAATWRNGKGTDSGGRGLGPLGWSQYLLPGEILQDGKVGFPVPGCSCQNHSPNEDVGGMK